MVFELLRCHFLFLVTTNQFAFTMTDGSTRYFSLEEILGLIGMVPEGFTLTSGVIDPFNTPLTVPTTVHEPDFHYYIYDHLGNTRIVYSTTIPNCGTPKYTLEAVMDYFPYGKILRQFIKTPEKYVTTGHERDVETGLDYRGARFYDSDVARFLSLDPLAAEFPEWSDYNYVLGNPVMFVDPDGRDVKPGENWKGSDYEKVYNKLRKNSKAYSNLLKPYEGKGARDYTLNNKGELGIRTAYTSPDFNKHDTNEEAFVRNYVSKEPNSEWRLHMQSTFVRNAEMKEIGGVMKNMNNIGRAWNLIHEGVHANIMSKASIDVLTNAVLQHDIMATGYVETIKTALKEFEPNLTGRQLDLLSVMGLTTNDNPIQNKLIAGFANKYMDMNIKADENGNYDSEQLREAHNKMVNEKNEIIYD